MNSSRDFKHLFEVLRGERTSELSNEQFLLLTQSLHATAIARLLPPRERVNVVETTTPALRELVCDIAAERPYPSAAV